MKSIFFSIVLVLLVFKLEACDLCGCNSGSYFIGPFPQYNSNFISTQYSFQNSNSVMRSDNSQFSNEFFQNAELLMGTKIKNNIQLLLFVPYNINYSSSDDGIKKNIGLGDISFIANYNLLDQKTLNKDTETVFQQFWIGGGVKIPTGKFSVDTAEVVSSAGMQAGTGSVDFLINTIYSYQIRSWGFNFNANYKINQSAESFKYGNRLALSTFVFHTYHLDRLKISPNIGLLYENLGSNTFASSEINDTGGNVLLTAIGAECKFSDFSLGANIQVPLTSNLSDGQTTPGIRGMCHLTYMW